ncbi:hypothetical protein SALBM135S_04636 [Streptomyces alboniger]
MVDCSGSMDYPPTKMRGARDATAAAIDALRDGVRFSGDRRHPRRQGDLPRRRRPRGGGHGHPRPGPTGPAQAERGRRHGHRHLAAPGHRILASADVAIRHGILLTDGRNEHESPEDLGAALDSCAGRFTCDARGVGTDWEVKEVTGIASALLGTADIVADPGRAHRRLHLDDGGGDGQGGRRRQPPAVDAGGRRDRVREAGRTHRRGADGPPYGGGPAGRGLPHRVLGRRVPRLPHLCTGARRRPGPGDARRPCLAGRAAGRRQRADPVAGVGARGVDGRHGGLHQHQSAGRALHGPGRTGAGHPAGAETPANREMSTGRPRNWAGPSSSPPPRATRIRRNCFRRWWTSWMPRKVLFD